MKDHNKEKGILLKCLGTVSECSGDAAQSLQGMEIHGILIKKRTKYVASTVLSLKASPEWGSIQWGKDKHEALGSPHSYHSLWGIHCWRTLWPIQVLNPIWRVAKLPHWYTALEKGPIQCCTLPHPDSWCIEPSWDPTIYILLNSWVSALCSLTDPYQQTNQRPLYPQAAPHILRWLYPPTLGPRKQPGSPAHPPTVPEAAGWPCVHIQPWEAFRKPA